MKSYGSQLNSVNFKQTQNNWLGLCNFRKAARDIDTHQVFTDERTCLNVRKQMLQK